MDNIFEFVDERQHTWCVPCGRAKGTVETNRDHVPSKCLLNKPYPPYLPVIEICKSCNTAFSLDEQYLVAFLGCVISGSTSPEDQTNPRIAKILRELPALAARIEQSKWVQADLFGEPNILWKPEAERVRRVVLKNARGHAFFEFGEPMLEEPDSINWVPLHTLSDSGRAQFEDVSMQGSCPEVGSRMMTRIFTGQDMDAGWVIVQQGVYRYAVTQSDGLLVRSVVAEYLGTEVHWN